MEKSEALSLFCNTNTGRFQDGQLNEKIMGVLLFITGTAA